MDRGRVRTGISTARWKEGKKEGERQEDGEKRSMRTHPGKEREREIMDAERSLPLP